MVIFSQIKFILIVYVIAINLIAFITYGIDKSRAVKKQWRIPEATLLTLAAIGGSVGSLLGMRVFRHKTKKPKFTITVPVLLFLQVAVVGYLGVARGMF